MAWKKCDQRAALVQGPQALALLPPAAQAQPGTTDAELLLSLRAGFTNGATALPDWTSPINGPCLTDWGVTAWGHQRALPLVGRHLQQRGRRDPAVSGGAARCLCRLPAAAPCQRLPSLLPPRAQGPVRQGPPGHAAQLLGAARHPPPCRPHRGQQRPRCASEAVQAGAPRSCPANRGAHSSD